ncbi:hypothetical protein CBL_10111 [Carabus blaptoides fortunei]
MANEEAEHFSRNESLDLRKLAAVTNRILEAVKGQNAARNPDTNQTDPDLRSAIIEQIQATLSNNDKINPSIRKICDSGLNARSSAIRHRLAVHLPSIYTFMNGWCFNSDDDATQMQIFERAITQDIVRAEAKRGSDVTTEVDRETEAQPEVYDIFGIRLVSDHLCSSWSEALFS